MQTIEKKINGNLFDSVVIETKADDVVISQIDDNECIIKTNVTSTMDNEELNHLVESGRYHVELGIKSRVLYIRYIKQDQTLINQPDYHEVVGLIILLPRGINYKHVKK